jgi:hypothetical protein
MNFKTTLTAGLLAAAMTGGAVAPALADGAASTRNILIVGGAAAAIGITNYNHKKRIKQQEERDAANRRAYRQAYYRRHGRWPS